MATSPAARTGEASVLVVDDQEPFRRVVCDLARGARLQRRGGGVLGARRRCVSPATCVPIWSWWTFGCPASTASRQSRRLADLLPEAVIVLVSSDNAPWSPASAPGCGAVAFMRKQDLSGRTLRAVWDRYRR